MKRNIKGFTLVEVLIVVIIIAIMASLILPRMVAQPEKAYLAEAQQMLGVIKRAQQTYCDVSGIDNCTYLAFPASASTLGMQTPATTLYTYSCTLGATSCTATRAAGGAYGGAIITLNDNNTWNCGTGNYTANAKGGCRLKV